MPAELEEFYSDFFQDVLAAADAGEKFAEDAFFELFCNELVDAGELDTADRAQYLSARGLRVDGYGGDPLGAEGTLNLIIVDFNQSSQIDTLTQTEMDATFKRLSNFLERSLDSSFRDGLEESSPAFGLADLVATRWSGISRVRLLLISNRVLSSRIDGRSAGEYRGVPVTYNVWDLGRLYRFTTEGHGREELDVDLESDFGKQPWPALRAHLEDAAYEAYLALVPAVQLAEIYDRWGARLLEQNVRSFLQARGAVNRGIRTTIENEPEMFLAYNNGITATAESVETRLSESGLLLTKLKNLQIVNGGQTTASIHAASRRKDVDLPRVFVQMKLSIIPHELAVKVVPKISQYANTQNRVNAADFFANHPFHVRMEGFSRRLYAPSPEGTFRQSKWFYERARGQYQDARANLTDAMRARFDLEYPKRQFFTKTDLAKFINVWEGHPDTVSKGAQKSFAEFAGTISKAWESQELTFNEDYYRHAIAKAIVFREAEKLVPEQPWYPGGYRANIVAYAIAKLTKDVATMGQAVNLDRIWRAQKVSPLLREALKVAAEAANGVITDTEGNVTEWAKQQACWSRAGSLEVGWPERWLDELTSQEAQQDRKREARKDQKMLNGIEAQSAVVGAGSALWQEVKAWGSVNGLLSGDEESILEVAASFETNAKVPSEKQSERLLQTLKRLRDEGCQLGDELPIKSQTGDQA